MNKFLPIALVFIWNLSWGQNTPTSMAESMRAQQKWAAYIMVSTKMSDEQLMALAIDAAKARVPLIFKGVSSRVNSFQLESTRNRIIRLNQICCEHQRVVWASYPQLFDRYKAAVVPAFVVAKGTSAMASDYVLVSGDLDLATALKKIAAGTKNAEARKFAETLYYKAYAN